MTNFIGSMNNLAGMNGIGQFNDLLKQNLGSMGSSIDTMGGSFAQGINPSDILNGNITINAEGQNLSKDLELNNDLKTLMSQGIEQSGSAADVAGDFSKAFNKSINELNQSQKEASNAMETLASGGNIDVHTVMIAAEKASLNMNMALQLRNKIVKAYQDISSIHV